MSQENSRLKRNDQLAAFREPADRWGRTTESCCPSLFELGEYAELNCAESVPIEKHLRTCIKCRSDLFDLYDLRESLAPKSNRFLSDLGARLCNVLYFVLEELFRLSEKRLFSWVAVRSQEN